MLTTSDALTAELLAKELGRAGREPGEHRRRDRRRGRDAAEARRAGRRVDARRRVGPAPREPRHLPQSARGARARCAARVRGAVVGPERGRARRARWSTSSWGWASRASSAPRPGSSPGSPASWAAIDGDQQLRFAYVDNGADYSQGVSEDIRRDAAETLITFPDAPSADELVPAQGSPSGPGVCGADVLQRAADLERTATIRIRSRSVDGHRPTHPRRTAGRHPTAAPPAGRVLGQHRSRSWSPTCATSSSTYVKQETVVPLKSLGRWIGFGVAGVAAPRVRRRVPRAWPGCARCRQRRGETFTGNWSWVPYLIVCRRPAVRRRARVGGPHAARREGDHRSAAHDAATPGGTAGHPGRHRGQARARSGASPTTRTDVAEARGETGLRRRRHRCSCRSRSSSVAGAGTRRAPSSRSGASDGPTLAGATPSSRSRRQLRPRVCSSGAGSRGSSPTFRGDRASATACATVRAAGCMSVRRRPAFKYLHRYVGRKEEITRITLKRGEALEIREIPRATRA